jgi:hypothetical protein
MITPPPPHACFFHFSDTCSLGSLGSNGSTKILVFDSFLEGRPGTGSRMLEHCHSSAPNWPGMGWTVASLQTEPHRRRANPNFEAGILIFLLPDTILQSPGELSPCLLFGESGSFLLGIVLTKPTID